MEPEHRSLILISSDGVEVQGQFVLWEESPANADRVQLAVVFAGGEVVREADDFFTALRRIREELEAANLTPRCYAASRNVYPSAMSLSMGTGDKAYRMHLGRPARTADLVDIFDDEPDVDPVSAALQEAYYREWLESLGCADG